MPKRKRITAAKLVGTLSKPKSEKRDVADRLDGEDRDFEPELTPAEEDSDPELNGNEKKKKKNKTASIKTTPEKELVTRKERIKTYTEDKNGDSIVRKPQVNSNYLPLPWKGRLGYVSPPPINLRSFPSQ